MNKTTQRTLRNKARLVCGLVNILQYDSDNISSEAAAVDLEQLMSTLQDTRVTLQNLTDTVTEMEYLLYLDRAKES